MPCNNQFLPLVKDVESLQRLWGRPLNILSVEIKDSFMAVAEYIAFQSPVTHNTVEMRADSTEGPELPLRGSDHD